ncbi:MAG: hypothetical protein AAF602_19430, partial [Myxococcota bacterium]
MVQRMGLWGAAVGCFALGCVSVDIDDPGPGDPGDPGEPGSVETRDGVPVGRWSTLGEGTDSNAWDAGIDDAGNVYISGSFEFAGGQVVNRVARWDGTAWNAVGAGFDDDVPALAVRSDGHVFAAVNPPARQVFEWDGTAWSDLAGGPPDNDGFEDMAFADNGDLLVAGTYRINPHARVLSWDGASWSDLGPPEKQCCIPAYAVDVAPDGTIYAGYTGETTLEGRVLRFDGSDWVEFAEANGLVSALAFDDRGGMYVGGGFTRIGNVAASGVAYWDGASFSAVGA